MQRSQGILSRLLLVLALLMPGAAAWAADTGFSDATMNPQDYAQSLYPQSGTVSVAATAAGNPGAALQMVFTVPAPAANADHTETYLIYRNFAYDPGSQGAVGSIRFAIDKAMAPTPASIAFGNGQGFIVEQGGRYYESDVALAAVAATFQTAQSGLLKAADFYLLTDPASHSADASQHPDFSAGLMHFGFFNGLGVPVGAPSLQMNYVYDNFGVSVQAVPEPSGAALALAGLVVLTAVCVRRTRVRELAP